jgi:hypothetical protein
VSAALALRLQPDGLPLMKPRGYCIASDCVCALATGESDVCACRPDPEPPRSKPDGRRKVEALERIAAALERIARNLEPRFVVELGPNGEAIPKRL